jgi:hypothetical protein
MLKREPRYRFRAETHRYFPEWADRPVQDGVLWESDHNSYSAGGYAEEFGYAGQLGLPPPARPLRGNPEQSRLWRIQVGCVHPGYPECSRPLDRDSLLVGATALWDAGSPGEDRLIAGGPGANGTIEPLGSHLPDFRVIRVGEHRASGTHIGFFRELVVLWKLFGLHPHLKRRF